jgi:hypothetical protein
MPTKKQISISKLQMERTHYKYMLAKNVNYFGNIPGSKLKPVLQMSGNIEYEEITCAGYNPETKMLEATISVKKSAGYSGQLCQGGSSEYLRFYLDFHDGEGFIDQGNVAINVHDMPAANDCDGKAIFPIKYAATLPKKTDKFATCGHPVLPSLRVILSWDEEPPADFPNWLPPWGNVFNCDVQLKPFQILAVDKTAAFMGYLKLSADFPHLSANDLAEISGVTVSDLLDKPALGSLEDIAKKYKNLVPPKRFAFKEVSNMIKYPLSEITMAQKGVMDYLKIDYASIIEELGIVLAADDTKANVDWEELECVGLDYNSEALVASLRIKKNTGYKEDLCHAGSKEYVAFWIDWGDCVWTYLNTIELPVHDIAIPDKDLSYQVTLPVDFTYHRKPCGASNIARVRCVLSWDTPPSTVDPDKLNYYGNRVDAHIQIKPGAEIDPGDVVPLYNIIGGIDVDHVDDASGLTRAGSFFAYNGLSVPTGAPFGGRIVLNGPLFPGYKYRVKVTNLTTGTSYYMKDHLTNLVGYLPHAPWVQYTNVVPDANGWYDYKPPEKNTLSVLARFTPGTNDKLLVEFEIQGIIGTFVKTIQMDNVAPVVKLAVDDEGDCTHFHKGDKLTGNYYVYDKFISSWSFNSTWGENASGTANTLDLPGAAFEIQTVPSAYPCGSVSLWAEDKTIVDSQWWGHEVYTSYNVCLQ